MMCFMTKTNGTWTRSYHEHEAIALVTSALNAIRFGTLNGAIKANRLIAQARTHLAAIGAHTSRRTDRLWSVVCKADRAIEAATERLPLSYTTTAVTL
jgi:hypothetical protein